MPDEEIEDYISPQIAERRNALEELSIRNNINRSVVHSVIDIGEIKNGRLVPEEQAALLGRFTSRIHEDKVEYIDRETGIIYETDRGLVATNRPGIFIDPMTGNLDERKPNKANKTTSIATNSHIELPYDLTGTSAIVDYESAEYCSLEAAKIRHATIGQLAENGSNIHQGMQRLVTIQEDGSLRVMDGTETLRVTEFMIVNDIRFAAWTENRTTGRLFKRQDTAAYENQPISFGLVYDNALKRGEILFPLLCSVQTPNGCHFILPNEQYSNDLAFNNPALMGLLNEVMIQKRRKKDARCDMLTNICHLVGELSRTDMHDLTTITDLAGKLITDDANRTQHKDLYDIMQRAYWHTYEHVEIQTKDEGWMPIELTAKVSGVKVAHGNREMVLSLLLANEGKHRGQDGALYYRCTIWGGNDPEIYGTNASKHYRRYQLEMNEYGAVHMQRYADDLQTLRDDVTADEISFIVDQFSKALPTIA